MAKALVEDELRESDPQRYIDSVDSEGRTLLHYLVAEVFTDNCSSAWEAFES